MNHSRENTYFSAVAATSLMMPAATMRGELYAAKYIPCAAEYNPRVEAAVDLVLQFILRIPRASPAWSAGHQDLE